MIYLKKKKDNVDVINYSVDGNFKPTDEHENTKDEDDSSLPVVGGTKKLPYHYYSTYRGQKTTHAMEKTAN